MNLSAPFILRPVMTTLVMVAILMFGVIAYKNLPVSDLPNVDYPTIEVTAEFPGASPNLMADAVATPLEQAFTNISGIHTMTSANTLGSTQIVLNFDLNKNIDSAAQDVQAAITRALPLLPNLPTNPTYKKTNPSQTPIMYIVFSSDLMPNYALYEYVNDVIAQPISMVNGVSNVLVYGSPYAIRVRTNPKLLASKVTDLIAVSNAVVNANPNLPSGSIYGNLRNYSIDTRGQLLRAEPYKEIILESTNSIPLRLKNVGTAEDSTEGRDMYFRYITSDSDQNCVVLAIQRQPGSNTLNVTQGVNEALNHMKTSLPASIQYDVIFDKASVILSSVSDVQHTLLIAFILVVLVIFIYLGKITETIVPAIVLPMSIIGTFIVMYFLGFSIDNLSMLALILAIGFIIDDAIVVLENIVRHVEFGETPYQAAINGSKQISITVFTMTIALASVFIPMVGLGGVLGRFFREFAITIVVAILFSGVISLTLTPMLASRFLRLRKKHGKKPNFSEKFNKSVVNVYEKILIRGLHHRVIVLIIGLTCLVGSYLILGILPADFLPQDSIGVILGITQTQQGTSTNNTTHHQKLLNKIIREMPYFDGFVSLTGYTSSDQGMIYIRLKPENQRPNVSLIIDELNEKFSKVPGINAYLKILPLIDLQVGNTSGVGDYQYTMQSLNADELYHYAEIMEKKMTALPGFLAVNSDLKIKNPQLKVTILRDKASTYGLTAEAIENTLQLGFSGGRITTINKTTNQYDVILELEPKYQKNISDLSLLYVKSPITNKIVPITEVASWKETIGPSAVNHINQFHSVTVSFSLANGMPLGTALNNLENAAREILPPNVQSNFQGAAQVFKQSFSDMQVLIVLAIAVIYIVLGILYESFIHPLTILSALPIAGFGAFLTLLIFNEPLSLYGFVGVIVLIGIVQKNGIMMIDYALEYLKRPGETVEQAIIEACKVRFRPIIMTTLAALMGALPIAFDTSGRRSMGLAVVGGLIFSQLITLFVTPVIFLYMQQLRESFDRRIHKKSKPEHELYSE